MAGLRRFPRLMEIGKLPKYEAVISLQLFLPVLENQTTMCYIYHEDVIRIQL